jgi:hypothetical protein
MPPLHVDQVVVDHKCVGSDELICAVAVSAEGEVKDLARHLN